jgi:hypothetical protein
MGEIYTILIELFTFDNRSYKTFDIDQFTNDLQNIKISENCTEKDLNSIYGLFTILSFSNNTIFVLHSYPFLRKMV